MGWLSGWTYRRSHVITHAAGSGTKYQKNIKAYYPFAILDRFDKDVDNPFDLPYHGGSMTLHPSVLYFPDGIDGYKYWMCYTPYGPDENERPCVVRSNDGETWTETGITNPVINTGGFNNADPDMIYISDISKWFIAFVRYIDSNNLTIALAYSSNGKTWTVLATDLIDGSEAYEKDADGHKSIAEPTMVYEDGWFYVWYTCHNGLAVANNQGYISLAKFQWDNVNNLVTNFTRDAGNPVFHPDANEIFKHGCGHISVSKYKDIYYMYAVREVLATATTELALCISTNKTSWTYIGRALSKGAGGTWDDYAIYRSSPARTGVGEMIEFTGKIQLFYTGYSAIAASEVGLATSVMPNYLNEVCLGGKCEPDFGDIRFTDDDGITEIDYWIEDSDTINAYRASIWVEVADDLTTNDVTIYIYYGKTGATTTSNGDNTFLLFDHFIGTTLDLNKWTDWGGTSVADSLLTITGAPAAQKGIHSKTAYPYGRAMRFKLNCPSATVVWSGFQLSQYAGFNNYGTDHSETYKTADQSINLLKGMGNYTYEIIRNGTTNILFYMDAALQTTHAVQVPIIDMEAQIYAWNMTGSFTVDWIFVRKFISPEPADSTWGDEEEGTITTIKTVTEILGILDAKSASTKHYTAEILGLKDTQSQILKYKLIVQENLGMLDTETPLRGFHKTITEILGILDGLPTKLTKKKISEILALSDIHMKGYHRVIAEILGMSDSIISTKHIFIIGVTRNASGIPIGNCDVWLFRTSDKTFIASTVSDDDGNFSFEVDLHVEYWIMAWKADTPNLEGTTDKNLKRDD